MDLKTDVLQLIQSRTAKADVNRHNTINRRDELMTAPNTLRGELAVPLRTVQYRSAARSRSPPEPRQPTPGVDKDEPWRPISHESTRTQAISKIALHYV